MPEKTDAQKRAQRKYMTNRATLQIVVSPERRDEIKAHAASRGESTAGFINRAITETIERDKAASTAFCEPSEGSEKA